MQESEARLSDPVSMAPESVNQEEMIDPFTYRPPLTKWDYVKVSHLQLCRLQWSYYCKLWYSLACLRVSTIYGLANEISAACA